MQRETKWRKGMIDRLIYDKMTNLLTKFPVVTLTGARQCGKSTLLRKCFPNYRYVSLEDLDIRAMANDDPRGFLRTFSEKTIIDEAQHAPNLFSYIQTQIDANEACGQYILSGSHNFLLMEKISQSLAGRTAILKMMPFSVAELKAANALPQSLNQWIFTGGYPRIYDKQIVPTDYFPNYIQTYIERDVRLLRNISNLAQFVRFLKLCAARIGQLVNINALANECDISLPTANAWLSVLETSYIVYRLQPYHKNFNKRLVKSPKLYFYDTGLAASLLGIESEEQLALHYLHGELFENMVISEFVKRFLTQGKEPPLYFWRDSNQNEVDLLVESGTALSAIEIKSSETIRPNFFKGLTKFAEISNLPQENLCVIYGGDVDLETKNGKIVSWRNL